MRARIPKRDHPDRPGRSTRVKQCLDIDFEAPLAWILHNLVIIYMGDLKAVTINIIVDLRKKYSSMTNLSQGQDNVL